MDRTEEIKVISKFAQWLYEQDFLYSIDVDYDWDENQYETITSLDPMMVVEEYMESRIINNEEDGDIF